MILYISIVVPVYQGESFIEELTRAILCCQEEGKGLIQYELIFVCDDPIDGSAEIAHSLSRRYRFVKVVELSCNSGQHLATAVGIMHAKGSWIATLDEDLQHSPHDIRRMLRQACKERLDIVYSKSASGPHKSFLNFRNLSSHFSKLLLRSMTLEDFTITSSFRLMRSEVGQAIAFSIDRNSYLDAALFRCTSPRRRGIFYTEMQDKRGAESSGYSLRRLIRHYGRLLTSIEVSGSKLASKLIGAFLGAIVILGGIYISTGVATKVMERNPGWISLFSIGSINILLVLTFLAVTIKFLSILVGRSTGAFSFIVIDRSEDSDTLRLLNQVEAEITL